MVWQHGGRVRCERGRSGAQFKRSGARSVHHAPPPLEARPCRTAARRIKCMDSCCCRCRAACVPVVGAAAGVGYGARAGRPPCSQRRVQNLEEEHTLPVRPGPYPRAGVALPHPPIPAWRANSVRASQPAQGWGWGSGVRREMDGVGQGRVRRRSGPVRAALLTLPNACCGRVAATCGREVFECGVAPKLVRPLPAPPPPLRAGTRQRGT